METQPKAIKTSEFCADNLLGMKIEAKLLHNGPHAVVASTETAINYHLK